MLKSKSKMIKPISLPEYRGDRVYMHEFNMENPTLPTGYERWESVVKEIVACSPKKTGKAYLTIDEKFFPKCTIRNNVIHIKNNSNNKRPAQYINCNK